MSDIIKIIELIPGWFVTSLVVVFTSAIQYVIFRTEISKDVEFNKDCIQEAEQKITDLDHRALQLEQTKLDVAMFKDLKDETLEAINSNRKERREDFQLFKEDVRANFREFKDDIRNDINNVLVLIKRNGNNPTQ